MLKENNRARVQAREARLPIVAELYKKGLSIRAIREEVNRRLDMSASVRTIHNDIKLLLKEWRDSRIGDIDELVSLELERINDCVAELWDQWEKSKSDYKRVTNSRTGVPSELMDGRKKKGKNGGGDDGEEGEENKIITVKNEQSDTNVVALGNPAYMAEIRQQLSERRKLLGLYDNSSRVDITTGGKPIDTHFQIEVIRHREEVDAEDNE
jgi:hypothetical protein